MNKENYTRISESIRRNKNLTSTQKLILGYLQSYQSKPDGAPTNNFYFGKQEELAEELGVKLRTLKNQIKDLEEKKLIFQPKKGSIDGKRQYKNRKAIIMVDEFNPYPEEAISATISTEPIPTPQEEEIVSKIEAEIPKTEYISIISTDEFHNITNNKYTYANSKILNTKINNLLVMYKSGEIETFDDLINEVELLKETQLETTN